MSTALILKRNIITPCWYSPPPPNLVVSHGELLDVDKEVPEMGLESRQVATQAHETLGKMLDLGRVSWGKESLINLQIRLEE